MRRNLNLVARSFYEMPCSFRHVKTRDFGDGKRTADKPENSQETLGEGICRRRYSDGVTPKRFLKALLIAGSS